MLSSSPPAVLPLISGFPPFCSHSHPPSARTCCMPTAPPVMLMDMAWSHQPSLYQETACSLQRWECAQQTSGVAEPPPFPWQCLSTLWSPLNLWRAINESIGIATDDRKKKKKKARKERAFRPGIAFLFHRERALNIFLCTGKSFFTFLH